MKAVLIDDEKLALEQLKHVLRQYPELEIKGMFTDPLEALAEINKDRPQVVFLDIDMPEINGLAVAAELLELDAGIAVVIVTGLEKDADNFFAANIKDCILKPVTARKIYPAVRKLLALKSNKTESGKAAT